MSLPYRTVRTPLARKGNTMSNPTPATTTTETSTAPSQQAPAQETTPNEQTPTAEATNTSETTSEESTPSTQAPAETDPVEVWKQHARTWETRARENQDAAPKLAEAERNATEATNRAEQAEARATALTVALESRLNPADVDLLLGAGDETKMRALAARLSQGSAPYVPDQGTETATPKPDREREFVRGLFKRND